MEHDFEESPEYLLQEAKLADAGNSESYAPVDYNCGVAKLQKLPSVQADLDAFFKKMHNPTEPLPPRSIEQPMTVEFNFVPRIDVRQETRNRLYLGSVSTQTQRHQLWGFDTWQEFADHLHPEDHKLARHIHEHVMTELALASNQTGSFRRRLWCIHSDHPTAGYWAITIDLIDSNERLVLSVYNQKKYINEATVIKRNELYYNPKNWQEI
jgi:hypothetical protein